MEWTVVDLITKLSQLPSQALVMLVDVEGRGYYHFDVDTVTNAAGVIKRCELTVDDSH